MSCFELVNNYEDEKHKNKKEKILEAAVDCLKAQEEKRTKELYEFIDDFVASQEYSDYMNDKMNIMRRSIAIQYDSNDIIVECQKYGAVEKYPLTEEQKKMFAFKRHFEKYAERQQLEREVKKQEHSIQAIKAKINEAQKIFQCTYESRETKREKTEQFIMQKYSTKFKIELHELNETTHQKLLDRFKKCHHALTERKKRRQENVYKIVEKLVKEYKIKKEVIKYQNKSYDYKVKPRGKIIENMEVVGTKIELIDRDKKTKPIEPEPEKIEDPILPITEVKVTKKKSLDQSKKPKKEKPKKKEKKTGDKKVAKEKKTKEKKEKPDINKLQLPVFPILNPREKILPENIDNLVDLVEQFRDFDNAMENSDMLNVQKNYILGDTGLKSKPIEVLFQNFDENRSYNKTITISNVSLQTRKVRFLKFEFSDEYDNVVFDIEKFGIQKLFVGCHIKCFVNFQPYDTYKPYNGKIVFLSYDTQTCQFYQFEVGIRCVPKYSNLKMYPEIVNFGAIPIWRAGNYEHFKVIKLQNTGVKTCTVDIRKIFDPLDIESILDEENKENIEPVPTNSPMTSIHDIGEILDQCLKNIDNNFIFERSFFTLGKYEERRVKVFFKNASYIGNYFEKYIVDVYDNLGSGNNLETVGCQTISLHAETTGHFLTTAPEVLDFGTCVLNSCYQLKFDICNGSNNSQAISIRMPSSLSDIVQSDVSTVYLSPRSKRTVFLKLSPRVPITQNSSAYFDKSSAILEFSFHLYVISKTAQEYPPFKVPVYAVLANFEDLTISCNTTNNLSNFLSTLLIDMGDCSIYETIWTSISLTNNTAVTQVCGFMDLPQAVTLEPHFGFCKLGPGQRKKFKLYLSPEIKDFPGYSIGSLRNSNYFFKLKVATVSSVGQLLSSISDEEIPETEKSSSLEMMVKKLTMYDNDMFASMTGLATEIKEYLSLNPKTESLLNKEMHLFSRVCSFILPQKAFQGSNESSENDEDQLTKAVGSFDTVLNFQNFLIVETNSRREVWCKVNLKRPLLEFSHQTVEFPDTPCGSYSVMRITLHAHESELEKPCSKKKSPSEYKASFQILGGSDEISVEPSCGVMVNGEPFDTSDVTEKKSHQNSKMEFHFTSKLEEYYRKFIELQEKLKKSEEQRFGLEMKFNEMVQVAKEEEQAHYRKLRAQYKRFLEEDKKRQDRNERIIRNLERIETRISMLSAKTERINSLRRQYQNFLLRLANPNRERKLPESGISRERSFVKEEPLREQQSALFRDDFSLPQKPKETLDLKKPLFEHPSVKKSLEKDQSNEDKIEILDRYLQSISSQRCRDLLSQEREAKEKLAAGTRPDGFFKDVEPQTNHATAIADDIMNSIYSRYYNKPEDTPKNSKINGGKGILNGTKEVALESTNSYPKHSVSFENNAQNNVAHELDNDPLVEEKNDIQVDQNKAEKYTNKQKETIPVQNSENYTDQNDNETPDNINLHVVPKDSIRTAADLTVRMPEVNEANYNGQNFNPDILNHNQQSQNQLDETYTQNGYPQQQFEQKMYEQNNQPADDISPTYTNDHTIEHYQHNTNGYNAGQLGSAIDKQPTNYQQKNEEKHQGQNENFMQYNQNVHQQDFVEEQGHQTKYVNRQEPTYQAQVDQVILQQPNKQYQQKEPSYSKQMPYADPSGQTQSDPVTMQQHTPQEAQYQQKDQSYNKQIPYADPTDQTQSDPVTMQQHRPQEAQYQQKDQSYNKHIPYADPTDQTQADPLSMQQHMPQEAQYQQKDQYYNKQIAYADVTGHTQADPLTMQQHMPQEAQYQQKDQSYNKQIPYADPTDQTQSDPVTMQQHRPQEVQYQQKDQSYNKHIPYADPTDQTQADLVTMQQHTPQAAQYQQKDQSYSQQIPYADPTDQTQSDPVTMQEQMPQEAQYQQKEPPYNKQIPYADPTDQTQSDLVTMQQHGQHEPIAQLQQKEQIHNADLNHNQSPIQHIQNNMQPHQYADSGPKQYDQSDQQIDYSKNNQSQSNLHHQENQPSVEYVQENLSYNQQADYDPNGHNNADQMQDQSQYDPSSQPFQYDQQYDENGQLIQYDQQGENAGYDQYGQPLMYNQHGQIVQLQYDEQGQIIPQYDENGQLIILYDQTGQQYDLNGQPVYNQDYNYTNQTQEGYDPNQYEQYQGVGQEYYVEQEKSQLVEKDVTEDDGEKKDDSSEKEMSNIEPIKQDENENEERKIANVMDILDTDTESTKQDTSKISNDTDFNFS